MDPAVQTPKELGYAMPAEWEPHHATCLAWPHSGDFPGKLPAVEWVFVELTRALHRRERVVLLVQDAKERRRAESMLARAQVELSQVDFFRAKTDRSWTRDYLPLFVVQRRRSKAAASLPPVGAVKWRFNGWARYPDHRQDEAAGVALAESLVGPCWLPQRPGRRSRAVLEGGSVDVDGLGSLLTTEACLLTGKRARFSGASRAQLEALLGDYLGIEQILWLPDGIAGDDTSGHIDDFARFAAPGVVVLCQESNRKDENHAPLRRARRALARARDARGKPLDLVELPMPRPLWFRGERMPASYANFYVANGVVLVPTFNDPQDRLALGLLQEAFPGREVVGIHALDLVVGLGTLHCSTQQWPAAPKPSRVRGGAA